MASDNPMDTEAAPDEIVWRAHPLTESVWRSMLLAVIIVVACYGAWSFSGYAGMALLALVVLIVSMAPYIFPTKYRINDEGIEIVFLGVRSFRGWKEFRNFYPHEMGVHLSTFRRPNGLDAFRGSFIRFAGGNREAVLDFLDSYIEREKKTGSENEKPPVADDKKPVADISDKE